MTGWTFLGIAIFFEILATTALKMSDGLARWHWAALSIGLYAICFLALAPALKTIPVGIAYAIWSGVGVALIALVAWVLYGQTLDMPAFIGIALIVAGVAVLNLYSKAVPH
jgi:small multidrug resistance pump